MKFLMINSVCGIGSTGRICTDIAATLEKNGNQCKIAYGRSASVPDQFLHNAIRIGNSADVRWHAAFTRLTDRHGCASYLATYKFIRWVKEYNPDIIHLHNLHGYYINLELLFSYLRESGKPVIWTLHDCWAFTGHCAHYTFAKCSLWQTGCHKCPQKSVYPKSFLIDASAYNWKRKKELFTSLQNLVLVTPSQWLAQELKHSFFRNSPCLVIPNAVDLSMFKPTQSNFREKYNLQKKHIILGVSSIWDQYKGLLDFAKLSQLLDDSYQIVLVGVKGVQCSNLPTKILALPKVGSQQELAAIYSAADVFVNPTHQDTFPTVNMEALACGTPVVTYPIGGSQEIPDRKSGVITEDDSPSTLPNAIDLAMKLCDTDCVARAANFNASFQMQKYTKLYNEVVNNDLFRTVISAG